jgi:Methyltransferase domain
MAESLVDWLALREPADAAARSAALTRWIASRIERHMPVRIVDLGAGTGSNVRFLASRLPRPQHWLLVDRDAALLAEARGRTSMAGVVETCETNLGAVESLREICAGRHLVTASALLDLVSESWLDALAGQCRVAGAAALFALTYDGRSECRPAEPEDHSVRALMNRHQKRSDHGFGAAAGPDAVVFAERAFRAAGYDVQRERSDWILDPDARDLQHQLIEGWAGAAGEVAPDQSETITNWMTRRLAHVEAGRSRIVVGHQDLIAWPRATFEADQSAAPWGHRR